MGHLFIDMVEDCKAMSMAHFIIRACNMDCNMS